MLTKIEVVLSQWVKDFTEGREKGIAVPCGECHACCTSVNAQLYPNEVKKDYIKKFSKTERKYHLKHKPNGECVYLTTTGCSIHYRVPRVCRSFDCRFMGYFNILDPTHEHINEAAKRWIFNIDDKELHQYCYKNFEIAVNLLPVKAGDAIDRAAKNAIYSAYQTFFGEPK